MSKGTEFRALIERDGVSYEQLRAFLEGLGADERREAIEGVGGVKRQRKLFELAKAGPAISVDDLIAKDKPRMEPVIFYGKNSLPTFTIFQKRFCRPPESDPRDVLYGYNHQAMSFATGPGYFVTKNFDHELGRVGVDYHEVPAQKPDGWPTIKENSILRSRFVYYKMIDYLRQLAPGVFIGRAVRHGKVTENYFLLSREY